MKNPILIIVDDNQEDIDRLKKKLDGTSYEILVAHSYQELKKLISPDISLIILDQYFVNTDLVKDFLGKEGNKIIPRTQANIKESEKMRQGFIILEKLREEGIEIPVILISAHEQNWLEAYRIGAYHLLDKQEMIKTTSDFLIKLIQDVLNDPKAFLGDTFSYNGILCEDKLKRILEEKQSVWRSKWKNLVEDFLKILQNHGIHRATSRHFYDYEGELTYQNYQRNLTPEEIREYLQQRFHDVVFTKEYQSYFLYQASDEKGKFAIYVLRDTFRYTEKSVRTLDKPRLKEFYILATDQPEYLPLPLDSPFSPNNGIIFFTANWNYSLKIEEKYRALSADQLDDFYSYCNKFKEKENYDNLKRSIDWLYERRKGNSLLPENIFFFVDATEHAHIRYLDFPLEKLLANPINQSMRCEYFCKDYTKRYFVNFFTDTQGCNLSYIHKFCLLYYWLKNDWPDSSIIQDLAKTKFIYFQTIFTEEIAPDIFNSFYKETKDAYIFIHSAFTVGNYKIGHPVYLYHRSIQFDYFDEKNKNIVPTICNLQFSKKVKLEKIKSKQIIFKNCSFQDELILENIEIEDLSFVDCSFDKITIKDSPNTPITIKGCQENGKQGQLIFKGEEFLSPIYLEECKWINISAQNTSFRNTFTFKQPRENSSFNFDKTEFYGEFKLFLDDFKSFKIKINRGQHWKPVCLAVYGISLSEITWEGTVFHDSMEFQIQTLSKLLFDRVKFYKELILPFSKIIESNIKFCHLFAGLDNKESGNCKKSSKIILEANQFERSVNLDNLQGISELILQGNIFYFPFSLKNCSLEQFQASSVYREISDFSSSTFTKIQTSSSKKELAIFSAETKFSGCHFLEQADFKAATFEKSVDFRNAVFSTIPNFQSITVAQVAQFKQAVFEKNEQGMAVDFSQADIKHLDLSQSIFKEGYPVLANASIATSIMSDETISAILTTRYTKLKDKSNEELQGIMQELKHFQRMLVESNNFVKADEVYIKICEIEHQISKKEHFRYWLGKYSCLFGTSFIRPLFWMIFFTVSSAIYLFFREIPFHYVPHIATIFCGAAPDIVLPYGEELLSLDVWFVGFSAIVNLLLINLFLVTLARKLIR